jgi:hypothetical protein
MRKRKTSDESRLWRVLATAATMLLATAAQTAAQPPPDVAQTLYRWTAPTPAEQLAADTTVVPAGMGALFVPAMTNGADEPEALVYQDQKQVGGGPNGQRIILPPGSYVLRVGSAPLNQMVTIPVDVTAGNTTLVPVRWGALVVEVVDKDNVPHRGSYELIQVSDRQPYTVGFGADTLVGERIRTLLVGPGLYRIVRPGSNYRARTDFSTVLVPEGSPVYFKLVLDPDDGTLLGAGVVPPEELGIVTTASGWNRSYSIGIGLPFSSTKNVVGASNQTSIGLDTTFDFYMRYDKNKNYFSSIFELEEGFVNIDPQDFEPLPLQKTNDRLRFDLLYTRFLSSRIGPYVRFGLLTNVFESNVLVTEPTLVTKNMLDGSSTTELVDANSDFKVGDGFAPVLLREGAGINFRLVRSRPASLDWRVGLGARQNRYNNSFVQDNSPSTGRLVYNEQENFNQTGVETTIVGDVRVRRLLFNTNLDLFGDFDDFENPTLDWRNTFSFRLTSALSVDYRVDLLEQPQVTDETQVTQSLLFRFSWGS